MGDKKEVKCGERGIRTPGSIFIEQRFSSPPHSTALPSLLLGCEINYFPENLPINF